MISSSKKLKNFNMKGTLKKFNKLWNLKKNNLNQINNKQIKYQVSLKKQKKLQKYFKQLKRILWEKNKIKYYFKNYGEYHKDVSCNQVFQR